LDSIANGLGIKQNSSTISWDFKHNILWRDLQVLDGHQKMDKTWKDAFPKSCSHRHPGARHQLPSTISWHFKHNISKDRKTLSAKH
jgi:hypothetical protein